MLLSASGLVGGIPLDARRGDPGAAFEAVYERRLHPFCALYRNTPLFRRVAAEIGFHPYRALLVEVDRYLDTGELLPVAMRAFGYRALRADVLVGHCFAVSYDAYGEGYLAQRAQRRDALLRPLRERGAGEPPRPAPTAARIDEGLAAPRGQ